MKSHLHNFNIAFFNLKNNALKLLLPVFFCIGTLQLSANTRTWTGYGAGGSSSKTDISARANWSGGTTLLSTDDYVMTFSSTGLGSSSSNNTFTLSQLSSLTFKSLTINFNGNGTGLKKVIINTSKTFNITNVFTINNTTTGNDDHEIDFNITDGTVTCGSVKLNASGPGGGYGSDPQLFLKVSDDAALVSTGTFTVATASGSNTSTSIENAGTITINGSIVANSVGDAQIYFDANASGVFNMNGAVSLGTSGSAGVFLSTFSPGTSTGKFYFRNNVTFGSRGFVDPSYSPQSYTFDGTGTEALVIGNSNVYFSNLIIGDANSPVVNVSGTDDASLTANANSANLTINNNSILNLSTKNLNRTSAGGILTLNQTATLKLAGTSGGRPGSNFPSNFNVVNLNAASTVEYNGVNGTTQTIYATPVYGKLSLTNGSGTGTASKNITADAVVKNTLTLNDKISFTIPAGKTVTLQSDATTTARVAEINTPSTVNLIYGGSGSGKGKFIVERYISAVKGWRFLAVPTNGTEFIHDAWQEGQAANNTSLVGKGIQLTSNSFPNGFDLYSSTSSLKTYDPASVSWIGVPSTLAAFDNSKGGYMTFIRGDRTVNAFNQAPTATVLRTSGEIYIGDKPFTLTGTHQFKAIGNPYASSIDFTKIYSGSTGISQQFYVYDPKAGTSGVGGYQTIIKIGSVWKAIPGGGSYPVSGSVDPYVESGQAFFVYSTSASGSVSIKESSKVSESSLVSRTAGRADDVQGLSTSIYGINADASSTLLDGVYNEYNNDYSNDVDQDDAQKSVNFGLNLSIRRNNELLVVDKSQPLTDNDTIFLDLSGIKVQQYRFVLVADNLETPGLQAYLEDSYLHTQTPVSFSDTTILNFSIANIPGSYATDRFRIVFAKVMGPLPVNITTISASRNSDETVTVNWKADNETSMDRYETERSADGKKFSTINVTAPKQNNGGSSAYQTIDSNPLSADNFYRIKAVSLSGQVQYSAIVKVAALKTGSSISVYPNPVAGKIMNIQFVNQAEGDYKLQLSNVMGQVVYNGTIKVTGTSMARSIALGSNTARGIYQLSITSVNGTKTNQQIIIE